MEEELITSSIEKNLLQPSKIELYSVECYITNRCNLKCKFCSSWKTQETTELKDEQWLRMILSLKKVGIKKIGFCGSGEPLIRTKLIASVPNLLKRNRIEGWVFSNGTLWNDDLIKNFVKNDFSFVTFSIDSHKGKMHDFLRGKKGTLAKCVNTIKRFNYFKKLYEKEKPIIRINTVLTKYNYMDISGLISLASEMRVSDIFFQKILDTDPNQKQEFDKLRLNKERYRELKGLIEQGTKLSKKLNVGTNLEHLNQENVEKNVKCNQRKVCYEPLHTLLIDTDGHITPCWNYKPNEDKKIELNMKKFLESETYKQIAAKAIRGECPYLNEQCFSWRPQLYNYLEKRGL